MLSQLLMKQVETASRNGVKTVHWAAPSTLESTAYQLVLFGLRP
jgi:hypothetical protein